jgi:tetratricopeptide (TPR) repeat protein
MSILKAISQYVFVLLAVAGLLALNPEELGEPWSDIVRLIDAGKYTDAIDKLHNYSKSSLEDEHLAEIYYRIGYIHHEYTHNYHEALKAYQKVVDLSKKVESTSELEPYLALSHMSIAGIYRRIERYKDAIKIYKEIAAAYPETVFADVANRDIKGIQDGLEGIELQKQTISEHPGTEFAAEAQFEIAELYLSIQNLSSPQRAIQEYSKLVDQYPNSRRAAEAQLKIGDAYRTLLHKPVEAIAAYQKLVQGQFAVSKLRAEAFFWIGRTYYSDLHDYRKALEAFNRFVQDYPAYWKFPAAIYWQGMCYEQLEDYDNAITAFSMFVQICPEEEIGWLADIGRLGERNVKERIESKIEELRAQAPEAKWREAERLRSREKYREALFTYRELMNKYPDSEYYEKAKVQADNVKNLAEIQIHQDIIRRNGIEAPASQYRIAEIYEIEMQNFPHAIKEYEKVAANYPDTYWATDALYRMGLIYSGANSSDTRLIKSRKSMKPDYHKAIEKYRQLIKEYPDTYMAAKAYYQMGEIYRTRLKNYKDALEAYTKVVEEYPRQNLYVGDGYKDSLADEAQFRIGRLYYENFQDYDMALKTFRQFLNDYPDSCRTAAAYSFVAAIQEKQKDHGGAVDSFERIIDIIVDSDVQNSFFIRDALHGGGSLGTAQSRFEAQRDIIKQIRQKISHLQGQK